MKFRNGFVSNSSSSSFVILGFKLETSGLSDEESDKQYDKICELRDQGKALTDDGRAFIGKILSVDSDGCGDLNNDEFSLTSLVEESVKIANEHNVGIEEIKLYMGTRQC